MHFFDEVQIPQFSTSIPVRTWSFAGYKEFALHYWFRGQPGSKSIWKYTSISYQADERRL
jgi:hypothetical protein